jgi:hypothetical protein
MFSSSPFLFKLDYLPTKSEQDKVKLTSNSYEDDDYLGYRDGFNNLIKYDDFHKVMIEIGNDSGFSFSDNNIYLGDGSVWWFAGNEGEWCKIYKSFDELLQEKLK